ncbi:protein translocase subunit SecD [uncultured Cellulomonas sp.]|uniref:protein translocase subunit SecD n=1 Tax=uncultured Cellulomonas sp. TaxID=189682 RepID=UPI0026075C27|nr:protein translocase subunit SecD [uncultured Cellulomonas sp.]
MIVAALIGAIAAGTRWSDASWAPELALDLEGGTQLILTPVTEDGEEVTDETIDQAIAIIRQRVDSSGVAEAEITSQGGTNIVVGLPGTPSEETLDLVRTSAQMRFRPVLAITAPTPIDPAAEVPAAEDPAVEAPAEDPAVEAPAEDPAVEAPAEDPTPQESPTGDAVIENSAAFEPTTDEPATEAPAPGDPAVEPAPEDPAAAGPESASDIAFYLTPEVQQQLESLDCTDPANLTGGTTGPEDAALVTCDVDGTAKYLLGPVEVRGDQLASATSGLQSTQTGATTGQWVVNLDFDGEGTRLFRDVTTRLQGLPAPQNQFAMVLDGLVISAPSLSPGVIISDGNAEISGSFTRETAATLANQLNFGALPLTFEVQSEEQISATLGSEQLRNGLIAGAIGLALVALYSLVQYRALGLVTIASLLVAALLTYGVITVLSWLQGYRLSLPGVAGLIVAIGITADSFIVYFERIRDELREGRTLVGAVDRGWQRARRTILASDAVSFLAAVVLYFLAVGGVRGFAFTLGLTTVIDLVVVMLFTHPVMQLAARSRFFSSGHRLSGLDPRRLAARGPVYAGRGRVAHATPATTSGAGGARAAGGDPLLGDTSSGPDAHPVAVASGSHRLSADGAGLGPRTGPVAGAPSDGRQTIAERRAAERAAQRERERAADPAAPDTTTEGSES